MTECKWRVTTSQHNIHFSEGSPFSAQMPAMHASEVADLEVQSASPLQERAANVSV